MSASTATVVDGRPSTAGRLVLRGGTDAGGTRRDLAIDTQTGRIVGVGVIAQSPDDIEEDCRGLVVVPAGVDVHAHLDKALSPTGSAMPADLDQAVDDWLRLAPTLDHDSYVDRATRAVEAMVRRGTTVIRTHADVGAAMGLTALNALISVRDDMKRRGLCDIQVVALAAPPLGGTAGHQSRRLLEQAVEAGVDVVGGSPDIDPEPLAATTVAVEVAAASGLPIDLHTDQSTDPGLFFLPDFVRLVEANGITRSSASHCVSLASQPEGVQHEVAAGVARVGMSVFTMPLTSLFFFGWGTPVAPPRGVTAIRALLDAGVCVAAGGDNVRDVFFRLGAFDAMEVAAVLAMVAHLSAEDAWQMCTAASRQALGLPPVTLTVGSPADLVAIKAPDLATAVAERSEHRIVIHRGRIVARTNTTHQLLG